MPDSQPEDGMDWDAIPDDEAVTVRAEFWIKGEIEDFADAIDAIAERTGMDELRFNLVADVQARGPKTCVVAFMEACEESLDLVPQG
jgi:hypothetical protein